MASAEDFEMPGVHRTFFLSLMIVVALATAGTAGISAFRVQRESGRSARSLNPRNLPVITVSDRNLLFSELMIHRLFQSRKFVVLEFALLGNTLAEIYKGRNGIGAKYLLDGMATSLEFPGTTTWQATIFSTATGQIVAMETVTGEVNSFGDLDRLTLLRGRRSPGAQTAESARCES
jgi:hypothetical protein